MNTQESEPTIIDVTVEPASPGAWKSQVTVLLNDGESEVLLTTSDPFDGEESFSPEIFLGLTLAQAKVRAAELKSAEQSVIEALAS